MERFAEILISLALGGLIVLPFQRTIIDACYNYKKAYWMKADELDIYRDRVLSKAGMICFILVLILTFTLYYFGVSKINWS